MEFLKAYFKFHGHLVLKSYRWLILKTDKNLFAILFNIKSLFLRSSSKVLWNGQNFVLSDKAFPSKNIFVRHQTMCNDLYQFGIQKRLANLENAYFLEKMNFSNGDVFVDCGANIGDLKLWFDFNNIKIEYIGFEPSPIEFKCLSHNAESSEVFNYALWNEKKALEFYLSSQEANSSIIKPPSFDQKIKIQARRLEDFINKKIKCLKLEAEGAEPEVLMGLGSKLNLIEFISADLSNERGVLQESTFNQVTNFLLSNHFKLIEVSHLRGSALFKNTLI